MPSMANKSQPGCRCVTTGPLTTEEIREYCAGQITHFKVPRYIKLVDEYPMTVTGKMQKFVMRDQYAEELGLS